MRRTASASAETATIVPMTYCCSSPHLTVAYCPRCCTARSSGATSVGCGGSADTTASSSSSAGAGPASSAHAFSSPKYSPSSPACLSPPSAVFASEASSSTHSRQPGGGCGQAGSGDQSACGAQPSGGFGQFGGGLKRINPPYVKPLCGRCGGLAISGTRGSPSR